MHAVEIDVLLPQAIEMLGGSHGAGETLRVEGGGVSEQREKKQTHGNAGGKNERSPPNRPGHERITQAGPPCRSVGRGGNGPMCAVPNGIQNRNFERGGWVLE